MKTLAIFDLDGTLLNTIDDLGHATNYALEQCGFNPLRMAAYPHFVGNGVRKLIERVLPEDARTPDTVEAMLREFKSYYDQHCTDFTRPYPGIPEMLRELADSGVHLAVASNKYQSAVERIIPHFFPDFQWVALAGHRDGVPTKPDPSVVFGVLLEAPAPKAEVIYVGDSGIDMETARRACVESVGVTWGYRPRADLRDHFANHIADTPATVAQIILSAH